MYNVAIVGFGYWGPNIARNFSVHPECTVKYICDTDADARARIAREHPHCEVLDTPEMIFSDDSVDIVAIVTPVSAHYSLAKRALEANKHVFVEKPMVETVLQATELVNIGKTNNLVCAVDHTYLYTSAIQRIKEIVNSGDIGEITYFDSVRINLGLFQHDVNVIWDLAPHDLSILFHITDERPISVSANGVDHMGNGLVDVAYLTLNYAHNMIANFHVNWLSPIKVRRILIGGTKKMIVFDDMEPSEKVRIYDKGIEATQPAAIRHLLYQYRSGDMFAPALSNNEALQLEIRSFIDQIESRDGRACNTLAHGKEVVEILEASDRSLATEGRVLL
jgi:predicted dehydrogenase